MRNEKRRKANKLLAWCRQAVRKLMENKFSIPRTRRAAEEELQRSRRYASGQWHRWYQTNRRYQMLTGGESLKRWQVR